MARLTGNRLVLRELKKEDYGTIHEWMNDDRVIGNLSQRFYPPQTQRATEEFLDRVFEGKTRDTLYFVITEKMSDTAIGECMLFNINWIYRNAEFAIVIGNVDCQGKGYGQETTRLLLDYAFDSINLHRVSLMVHADNRIGIECYRKAGFVTEGTMREAIYKNGGYVDLVCMGVLKVEYRGGRSERSPASDPVQSGV